MWINTRTEYSYGHVFGPVETIVEKLSTMADYAGIADLGNTYGYVSWEKICKKYGIKPIFGVQLTIVMDLNLKQRSFPYKEIVFVAKNNDGLKELYKLVELAYKQFYYRERVSTEQIKNLSDNIFSFDLLFNPYLIDNYYINPEDKKIYEPFAEQFKLQRKTSLMHIPTKKEWLTDKGSLNALTILQNIADQCNATLSKAPSIKHKREKTLKELCEEAKKKRGFPKGFNERYFQRFHRELKVIQEKGFEDYLLIVADLVQYAKTKMCVGPGRGSSAGSLICYLLGITEIDPIKYELLFERFIDLNREDLPDVDIDFQDNKRYLILQYLQKKFGQQNTAEIANINRFQPRAALTRFARNLSIPLEVIEEIKMTAINLKELFEDSENGKIFLKEYPAMKNSALIEDHVSHIGKHAAGILIGNKPIVEYCGINAREGKQIAMIDKRDAERLNLLKIDALGLRTLTIIAETCNTIKKPYSWIYTLPLDDQKTFNIFHQKRFSGIFQFEGEIIKKLASATQIENIEDIADISALGRPGPLASGAAWNYIRTKNEEQPHQYICSHPVIIEITKKTYGVIIYQEQVMKLVRELGGFSWEEVTQIRKAIAKSKGDEINKFKKRFIEGDFNKGLSIEERDHIWKQIETFGGYAFNKSHAVSYAFLSYYCAYLKAHYPLEFGIACLNNSKDDNSSVKILRDLVENEKIEYKHIDQKFSLQKWTIKKMWSDGNGKSKHMPYPIKTLLGGFTSLYGIGQKMADKMVKFREEKKEWLPGMIKWIKADISPFKYLYPAKQIYNDYYNNPEKVDLTICATPIKEIKKQNGSYNLIGKLIDKKVRDVNEPVFITKRNGKRLEGQTAYLIFKLEDDTEEIRCKIKREDYLRLGKNIAKNGQIDKDWYVVNGQKINNWDIILVSNIKKITKGEKDV